MGRRRLARTHNDRGRSGRRRKPDYGDGQTKRADNVDHLQLQARHRKRKRQDYHGEVQSFETFGAIENIKTLPSTGVSATGATLMGELTPQRVRNDVLVRIRRRQNTATKTSEQNAGSESKVISLEQAISLEPNTATKTGWYARTPLGTSYGTYSSMQSPAAPPTVIGESTSNVARQRAVLHATVNPNNNSTSYYSIRSDHRIRLKTSEQDSARRSSANSRRKCGRGTEEDTLYHFRVIAKNQGRIMRGPDATFPPLALLTPPVVTTLGVSGLSQMVSRSKAS